MEHTQYIVKVTLLGDLRVGKTSICMKYACDKLSTNYKPTLSVDLFRKDIQWTMDSTLALTLWDTAGQTRLQHMIPTCMKGSHGVVLVCDATLETDAIATSVHRWRRIIDHILSSDVPCFIFANKCDSLTAEERKERTDLFCDLAHKYNSRWCFTSCKTGEGLHRFIDLLVEIMNKRSVVAEHKKEIIKLDSPKKPPAEESIENTKQRCCS